MALGLGVGLPYFGSKGGVADAADGATSAAALFLAANGPHGMVLNFDGDASIAINDAADLLDFESSGQVSGGALVGPGAKTTYSAPSVKLTEQADGNLGFQAHNLCLWSEDVSNAAWTKTNCTASAAAITATATGSVSLMQSITVVTSATYELSLKLTPAVGPWARISVNSQNTWVDLSSGVLGTADHVGATVEPVDGGGFLVRLPFTSGGTATSVFVRVVDGNNSTNTINGYSLGITRVHVRRTPSVDTYIATTSAAAYDLPYVYSSGVRTGIMVEPAATNLIPQSAMGTGLGSWNGNNSTRTLSAEIDPFGGYAAMQIATNGNGGLNVSQPVSVTPGSVYTASIFLKGTPGEKIFFMADAAFQVEVTFTGQWQRITKTFTATTNPTYFGCERYNRSGGAHLPDVTFHATGAQLETGTVATSPIITYGAAVARAVDNISIGTSLFPFDATTGTLFIEAQLAYATGGAGFTNYLRIDDGTVGNRIAIYRNGSNTSAGFDVTTGGAAQGPVTRTATDLSASTSLAGAYAANDLAFVIDGGTVGTDGTASTAASYSILRIGRDTSGTPDTLLNGYITKIAYFPRRLSNAELQALTA